MGIPDELFEAILNPSNSRAHSSSLLLTIIGERQANPPVQVRKPGVMMDGSEIGNGVKKNQAACAVSVRLLQPSECLIRLAKLRINLCQFDGQIFLAFCTLE
jgi:hypothetical protein